LAPAASRLLLALILQAALGGCDREGPTRSLAPANHSPIIEALRAVPDTIGPSDSTVVTCIAHDVDGDTLRYDWATDARLDIQGTPTWNKYLNNQRDPSHTFYNAHLRNPINDSAWVYCEVRDSRGGGDGRTTFIILTTRTTSGLIRTLKASAKGERLAPP
jgi:hypothetical protein